MRDFLLVPILIAVCLAALFGGAGIVLSRHHASGPIPVLIPGQVQVGNKTVWCVVSSNPYHLENGGGVDCDWGGK